MADIADYIIARTTFGDVDYGPTFGQMFSILRNEVTFHPEVTGEALFAHLTHAYEDDWQEWKVLSADEKEIVIAVFIKWGDGHLSDTSLL